MSRWALGLIETLGLVGSIEAADAAAKAAAVVVASAELTPGSLMSIRIEGELGAVQAAIEAGVAAAEKVGQVVAVTVIPNPDDGLGPIMPGLAYVSKYHPDDDRPQLTPSGAEPPRPRPAQPPARATARPSGRTQAKKPTRPQNLAVLKKMTVAELRKLARSLEDFELQGREVSAANKQTLVDAIGRTLGLE